MLLAPLLGMESKMQGSQKSGFRTRLKFYNPENDNLQSIATCMY